MSILYNIKILFINNNKFLNTLLQSNINFVQNRINTNFDINVNLNLINHYSNNSINVQKNSRLNYKHLYATTLLINYLSKIRKHIKVLLFFVNIVKNIFFENFYKTNNFLYKKKYTLLSKQKTQIKNKNKKKKKILIKKFKKYRLNIFYKKYKLSLYKYYIFWFKKKIKKERYILWSQFHRVSSKFWSILLKKKIKFFLFRIFNKKNFNKLFEFAVTDDLSIFKKIFNFRKKKSRKIIKNRTLVDLEKLKIDYLFHVKKRLLNFNSKINTYELSNLYNYLYNSTINNNIDINNNLLNNFYTNYNYYIYLKNLNNSRLFTHHVNFNFYNKQINAFYGNLSNILKKNKYNKKKLIRTGIIKDKYRFITLSVSKYINYFINWSEYFFRKYKVSTNFFFYKLKNFFTYKYFDRFFLNKYSIKKSIKCFLFFIIKNKKHLLVSNRKYFFNKLFYKINFSKKINLTYNNLFHEFKSKSNRNKNYYKKYIRRYLNHRNFIKLHIYPYFIKKLKMKSLLKKKKFFYNKTRSIYFKKKNKKKLFQSMDWNNFFYFFKNKNSLGKSKNRKKDNTRIVRKFYSIQNNSFKYNIPKKKTHFLKKYKRRLKRKINFTLRILPRLVRLRRNKAIKNRNKKKHNYQYFKKNKNLYYNKHNINNSIKKKSNMPKKRQNKAYFLKNKLYSVFFFKKKNVFRKINKYNSKRIYDDKFINIFMSIVNKKKKVNLLKNIKNFEYYSSILRIKFFNNILTMLDIFYKKKLNLVIKIANNNLFCNINKKKHILNVYKKVNIILFYITIYSYTENNYIKLMNNNFIRITKYKKNINLQRKLIFFKKHKYKINNIFKIKLKKKYFFRKKKYIYIKKRKIYLKRLYSVLLNLPLLKKELFVLYLFKLKLRKKNLFYKKNRFFFYKKSFRSFYKRKDFFRFCSNIQFYVPQHRNIYMKNEMNNWFTLRYCKIYFLYKIKDWKELYRNYYYGANTLLI